MRHTTKIWRSAGGLTGAAVAMAAIGTAGISAESVSAAQPRASAQEGEFEGDLDQTLEKIFGGEGGEGGAGLTSMWPRVSAPALSSAEIAKVVTGNTLSMPAHMAYFFLRGGAVEGTKTKWKKEPDLSKCPPPGETRGDLYHNPDTRDCWRKSVFPMTGNWSTENHRLCVQVSWGGTQESWCRNVAILLDNIALFEPAGTMYAKGFKLLKGRQIDR